MVFIISENVLNADISWFAKILFGRINTLSSNGEHAVRYTNADIQRDFSVSTSTIKRALSELTKKNFIQIKTTCNANFNRVRNITIINKSFSNGNVERVKNEPLVDKNNDDQRLKNDPTKGSKMTLSSSLHGTYKEHINNMVENLKNDLLDSKATVTKKRKRKESVPVRFNSFEEVLPVMQAWINKYQAVYPQANQVDLTSEAIAFYEYYNGMNWLDRNGQPLKNAAGRVNTWLQNKIKKRTTANRTSRVSATTTSKVDALVEQTQKLLNVNEIEAEVVNE